MGDNGEVKSPEAPAVEMRIVLEPGKPIVVHFPLLNDQIATYGFLKTAEKVIDSYYKDKSEPKIVQHKGGIMNFVRNKN